MAITGPKLLKAWRRSKQWTQDSAAEYFGVVPFTYLRWEQGKRRPGAAAIVRMWAEGIAEPNAWFERPEYVPQQLLAMVEREAMQ